MREWNHKKNLCLFSFITTSNTQTCSRKVFPHILQIFSCPFISPQKPCTRACSSYENMANTWVYLPCQELFSSPRNCHSTFISVKFSVTFVFHSDNKVALILPILYVLRGKKYLPMPYSFSHVVLKILGGGYCRCFPTLYRKFRFGFQIDFISMYEIISQLFRVVG